MKKEKKLNIEDKIWNFVDNNTYFIYFVIITLLSIVIRYLLIEYPSGDYDMFLKPWFNDLKTYGGLG